MLKKKIGIFISGGGSNLQAIIDNMEDINGEIKLILSNKKDAYGLVRAEKNKIDSLYIEKKDYDKKVLKECIERELDLIVLAGYLKTIDGAMIKEFKNKIINIHPSLLPSFGGKGFYGEKVHRAVYEKGLKLTGATVHFVDEGVDTGPIILQESTSIGYDNSVEDIQKKVLKIEHKILPEAVKLFCEDRLELVDKRVRIL